MLRLFLYHFQHQNFKFRHFIFFIYFVCESSPHLISTLPSNVILCNTALVIKWDKTPTRRTITFKNFKRFLFIYLYTALHVSGTVVPIIRSLSFTEHAVSVHRVMSGSMLLEARWTEAACAVKEKLLMMGTTVPETCSAVYKWINKYLFKVFKSDCAYSWCFISFYLYWMCTKPQT
jgi:hypothetical protein